MTRTSRKTRTPRRAAATPALATLTRKARTVITSSLANARRLALGTAAEAREAAFARADEARARTLEAVSHLEKVFEDRVSKAIHRLGVPTSRDVRDLSRRVSELQASVERLKRSRARA